MIKELGIQNFKCFQHSPQFKFSKINLLTGINGRGKSSLLQTFLLLSQSARANSNLKVLNINDEFVNLGNYDDIKNSETPRAENIRFNLVFDNEVIDFAKLQYRENEQEGLIAELVDIEFHVNNQTYKYDRMSSDQNEMVSQLSELFKKIHYVSADRLGPVKYVDKINLPQFVNVGVIGEYCVNILANSDNLPLVHDNLYRGSNSKKILQQTEEWLSYILEGAKINIIGKEKESSVLSILLNNKNNSYSYKPNNVGFGYSYILPLVLTGLIAKPGELVIIENPEAHLHPRAQSKITEFFAKVASCGVQVFIESHSEHILNGLRVCALNPNENISYNEISILYFTEGFTSLNLTMDSEGKIANWPVGFFDQQEIDLSNIFRYGQ